MPSHPRFLPVVRAAVSELGAACGLPEPECRGITLAVDEALANIIRHAYKNRYDREIEVHCQAGADKIEFRILDRGEPADQARICAQPMDAEALSGRGTHMIRSIMDEVCYEQVHEGNQLRLSKRLPADALLD